MVIRSPSGSLSLDSTEVAPPVVVVAIPPSITVIESVVETGGFVLEVNSLTYTPRPNAPAITLLSSAEVSRKFISNTATSLIPS